MRFYNFEVSLHGPDWHSDKDESVEVQFRSLYSFGSKVDSYNGLILKVSLNTSTEESDFPVESVEEVKLSIPFGVEHRNLIFTALLVEAEGAILSYRLLESINALTRDVK